MIRINQLKLPVEHKPEELKKKDLLNFYFFSSFN